MHNHARNRTKYRAVRRIIYKRMELHWSKENRDPRTETLFSDEEQGAGAESTRLLLVIAGLLCLLLGHPKVCGINQDGPGMVILHQTGACPFNFTNVFSARVIHRHLGRGATLGKVSSQVSGL